MEFRDKDTNPTQKQCQCRTSILVSRFKNITRIVKCWKVLIFLQLVNYIPLVNPCELYSFIRIRFLFCYVFSFSWPIGNLGRGTINVEETVARRIPKAQFIYLKKTKHSSTPLPLALPIPSHSLYFYTFRGHIKYTSYDL